MIKDFLAEGAAKRMHLERLPGYAPELDPDAGIWRYLKRVELKNRCCHDLPELRSELRLATARLRHGMSSGQVSSTLASLFRSLCRDQ